MKKLILLTLGVASLCTTYGQYNYPATKKVDSTDTYWGMTYKDPYRWMEHMKDPEVERWFRRQAEFTNEHLAKIPGRDALIAEFEKLDKLQPAKIQFRSYEGGRLFYKKKMPDDNVAKLYYREGMNGKEILLFDPSTHMEGKSLSITSALPSYDGKKIAIAYSEGGAEISTIRVMDVDSKTFLKETIYPSWFGPISWTFDNKSFTYFAQKTADNTSHDFELNTKTRLHVLGDDVKNDRDFFSNESYPDLNIEPNELPFAAVTKRSKKYIFADLSNVRPETKSYYAMYDEINNKKINWKVFSKVSDSLVKGGAIIGDDVYMISSKKAPNYKLLHSNMTNLNWDKAEVIAPERKDMVLTAVASSKDYLLLTYNDGINDHLYKYHLASKKMSPVKLPVTGAMYPACIDVNSNDFYVQVTSWNKPVTEYKMNVETGAFAISDLNKPPVFPKEYTDMVVEEVEVPGHDGEMIPLSIVYRKGLKKDGNNVCLMDSYGAYGVSMTPWFNPMEIALAVKGVVLAYPHVRGGGEKGEKWYRGGYKTTKPNTWKDFNSCAEYLVKNGYTSPARLSGTGTSAGGILISRAITERPDLYAAAICNVGCANILRMEFSPNGPANIPEFGTVKDSTECKALFEMDGVSHVKEGVKYPAVLSVAGWNDPRVIAWQPGKFAAAMQQSSASGKPVFMKVNYDNGHFTEDKAVTRANFADQFAFAMWQCGHPEFQVKQ